MVEIPGLNPRYREYLKQIEAFRLIDDDFMNACFDDSPECAELVLRILLDKPDLKVNKVRTQVTLTNLGRRALRLDVLATDDSGKIYNIEIQRDDRGTGRKRARLHSSLLDAKWTDKGTDPEKMPETFVIFLTEHDVLGHGLPIYHVERYILECSEFFSDGAHILYANGAYRDDSPVGKLMHDFSCSKPSEMHYDVLANRAKFFKESEKGVTTMCKAIEELCENASAKAFEQGIAQGIAQGIEQGFEKKAVEFARDLLQIEKMPPEKVAQLTRLPLEKVLTLC